MDDQSEAHQYIPLVLQTIIQRVGEDVKDNAAHIYACMIKMFATRNQIIDEALATIARIFEVCPDFVTSGSNFTTFLPYFISALRNPLDTSTFKAALLCIGSLCDALGKRLFEFDSGKFCSEIVQTLRNNLQVSTRKCKKKKALFNLIYSFLLYRILMLINS